ncbi:hypothetical protein E2320_020842, partial [Naja naja]
METGLSKQGHWP